MNKSKKSMTAEEIATKAFSDMHERENSWEVYIKAMKEYARLQIEKDRERVKANVTCSIPNGCPSHEVYEVDLDSIDNTPIILD